MLLKYLKEKYNIPDSYFDSIRFSLDEKLHYYGEHFKNPTIRKSIVFNFYDLKIRLYFVFKFFFKRHLSNRDKQGKLKLVSSAYFNLDLLIAKNGINVYRPPWSIRNGQNIGSDLSLLNLTLLIERLLSKSNFNHLISTDFKLKSDLFHLKLSQWLIRNKINAVIVANDVSYFDNTLIKVAKELNIPSYVFLHGLPARYNNIDDGRADFLLLWGEKLKVNYVKAGLSPHKLIVCGHPLYNYNQARVKNLRFGFSNILVLSKPLSGANHSDIDVLSDRANSILYLFMIQNVLEKFQVKNVRLRLHPSENSRWYKKYLDSSFFIFDNFPISNSIEKASLIIGPSSTVFLESIYFGVNYTIFEPSFNSLDILNNKIVSPFDGQDPNIPVANSEIELERMLRNKVRVNTDCLQEYFNEGLDLSFLMNSKINND